MTTCAPIMARFREPTADTPTRLAVLADLHLNVTDHGSWRVSHRTVARFERTVESLNNQEFDAVVFIGDLVDSGTRAEFEAFDRILAGLDHPFVAIPGNHDLIDWHDEGKPGLASFEDRYTPEPLPYHARIGGIDLLAMNSNQSTHQETAASYTGRIEPSSLAWLEAQLDAVAHPLVVVHHNLPGIRELYAETADALETSVGSPGFETAADTLATLQRGHAPLVLNGHLHFPAVVTRDGVREFTLPPLGPYPCGYTTFDIDTDGTIARFHGVATYDGRMEAFDLGYEKDRVRIAAAQLAGLPLVDEWSQT